MKSEKKLDNTAKLPYNSKVIDGKTYTFSDIETHWACDLEGKVDTIDLGDDDHKLALTVNIEQQAYDDCYYYRVITINGVEISYSATEGVLLAAREWLDVGELFSKLRPGDALREIIGDDLYYELTCDDTPKIAKAEANIKVEALRKWIADNRMHCYFDSLRGFLNEWQITFSAAELVGSEITADTACEYYREWLGYEENFCALIVSKG